MKKKKAPKATKKEEVTKEAVTPLHHVSLSPTCELRLTFEPPCRSATALESAAKALRDAADVYDVAADLFRDYNRRVFESLEPGEKLASHVD